jgi:Rap1a immunity proteins
MNILAPLCTIAALASSAPSFGGDLHQFDKQANFKSSGEYIRGCAGPKVSVNCLTDFVMTDIADEKSGQHCLPDTSAPSLEQGNAKRTAIVIRLVAWLKTHPEYSGKPASEGLSAAMHASYPCR